jgi:hypothetical protein
MLSQFGEKQLLDLAVNQERTHLIVRAGEDSPSNNENDQFSSNFLEIRLKVSNITRLEIGREKALKKAISSSKQVTNFTIVMRKPVAECSCFNFEAQSLTERDQIIGGIKNVLELTKLPSESRRSRSSNSPISPELTNRTNDKKPARREMHSTDQETKSLKTLTHKGDDIAVNAAVYFDFNLPSDGPDAAIEAEMRNDDSARGSDGDRDEPPSSDSDRESDARALMRVAKSEGNGSAMTVRNGNWSLDNLLCGMALAANPSMEIPSPTKAEQALHAEIGAIVNPFDGCNSIKALAAVEDVDLSKIGWNEVSAGPFCTDDVCTATFKDLADTMKDAFQVTTPRNELNPRSVGNGFVSVVLGAPTAVAANLLSVTDLFSTEGDQPKGKPPTRRSYRNRSQYHGAQASRLLRLRRQMTFDASIEHMPYVQIVNSYDDIERADRFGRKMTSADISKGHNESSQFLQMIVDNMEQDNKADSNEEILFYDSDPEDAREMALRRGPRRAIADLENKTTSTKAPREALSEIPMSRINMRRKLRNVDDETITDIIDRMKNEKMTLIWHPADSIKARNKAPFCSKVWIESGIYLIDGTFLLPKLLWVPVIEGNIQSKVLNATTRNPGTIDLLDVCRVRECKTIDRKLFPFANVERSFMIQTQTETQLFEARSRDERIRVVNALRLVIARLASLLMLRDLRAVDEFFGGNSVPGEAPAWSTGKNENTDGGTSRLP